MKKTLELPDDLLAAVEAEARRRSVSMDELIPELVRDGLQTCTDAPERKPLSNEEADAWLAELQSVGAEIYRKSVDDRSMVEILLQDRR